MVRRALTNRDENIAALNALLVQKDIENANLSRAVAELTETKADFYRSGVADGRAQKDAELAKRIAEQLAALIEAEGCFQAAYAEGLADAIAETSDERLRDLLQRRILYAAVTLTAAIQRAEEAKKESGNEAIQSDFPSVQRLS